MAQFGLNWDIWLSYRFEGKSLLLSGPLLPADKWEFGTVDSLAMPAVLGLVLAGIREDTSQSCGT